MLNRRGFLKGIFGAVALVAAAPALRVADAVVLGPPPPKPKFKVPSRDRMTVSSVRYQPIIKAEASEGGLPPGTLMHYLADRPVPDGWLLCDGRFITKGTYRDLELALSAGGRFPYGETHGLYRLPDMRGPHSERNDC